MCLATIPGHHHNRDAGRQEGERPSWAGPRLLCGAPPPFADVGHERAIQRVRRGDAVLGRLARGVRRRQARAPVDGHLDGDREPVLVALDVDGKAQLLAERPRRDGDGAR